MKKIMRFFPIILALTLTISAVSVTAADQSGAVISPFSKNAVVGVKEIRFSREDFASDSAKNSRLEGIIMTELPDKSIGSMKLGDRELLVGEAVVSASLGDLRFVPTSETELTAGFTFLPVFKNSAGSGNVNVSIHVLNIRNNPPKADDMSLATYKNVSLFGAFAAADPEGDALTFKITGDPKKGVVTIEDSTNKFEYCPQKNKTGDDSFKYVAIDKYGNMSEQATVSIKIEKAKTKTVYADMAGNPAHYAAITLAEKGVFTGEKIGDSLFFYPDREVSRGEFVAMTVSILGMDNLPVSRTGFADDDTTPVWVKPYMSTALKAGIIKGVATNDGRKVFLAESPILRAEAAVIINNAINLADNLPTSVFSDGDSVPVWAAQATINVSASGIMNGYDDGTLRPGQTATRSQAAVLLCAAIEFKEKREAKNGLLGWAKQ